MIRYVVEYLPVVEKDRQRIIDWYDQQQPDLGNKFLIILRKPLVTSIDILCCMGLRTTTPGSDI